VDRDKPRIVPYLKTDASHRDVDLSKEIAEYLRAFIDGRDGLLYSRPETVRHICTTISKPAGSQNGSKR
jgi:hypothetical protein